MTVAQLINKLQQFDPDLPVTIMDDIGWGSKNNPDDIKVSIHTWVHSNYPYDKPDFDYVNLG